MLTDADRLLNEVNNSTNRWKRQGHQRRSTVTDLHGIEYNDMMDPDVPAQFYTSISYDLDRFAHWWLKVIINPYSVKSILEGEGTDSDDDSGFSGNGSYTGGDIKYGGYTFKAKDVDALVSAAKEYGVLPSGAIVQLYLESMWGNSAVGRADNNWGGISGGAQTRPSGVVVTTGSRRPAAEGGTYMHYASVADFMKDYMYLLAKATAGNNVKMYNVAGKKTLEEYTKGLFRVGGAAFDYAAAGYASYINLMRSIYDGVNKANGDVLKKIDDQVLNGKPETDKNTTETEEEEEPVNPNQPIDPEGGGSQATVQSQGQSQDGEAQEADTTKTKNALAQIKARMGQTVGSGECYGLVALYSQLLGGPGLGGGVTGITDLVGGGMAAALIGTDYNWASKGWKVVTPQNTSDLRPGAMVTIKANNPTAGTGPYGHVAVVEAVSGDTITILEQNYAGKRYVVENKYNINTYLGFTNHVIYPPELASGGNIANSNGGGTKRSVNDSESFADDIRIAIDGVDFTPMFMAQFGGDWIDKYAIFPNDKPNEGYDVMLSAVGLSDEERAKIFTSGEHLVEVSGSMQADVTLRMYVKYNHLN